MSLSDLLGDEKYLILPKAIAAHPDLSQSAKLLYSVILDYCQRFGQDTVYPGQLALAKAIGLKTRRQVNRATQELEAAGRLMLKHQRVGSRTRITYALVAFSVDVPSEDVG
jgi:hypothetical protein